MSNCLQWAILNLHCLRFPIQVLPLGMRMRGTPCKQVPLYQKLCIGKSYWMGQRDLGSVQQLIVTTHRMYLSMGDVLKMHWSRRFCATFVWQSSLYWSNEWNNDWIMNNWIMNDMYTMGYMDYMDMDYM